MRNIHARILQQILAVTFLIWITSARIVFAQNAIIQTQADIDRLNAEKMKAQCPSDVARGYQCQLDLKTYTVLDGKSCVDTTQQALSLSSLPSLRYSCCACVKKGDSGNPASVYVGERGYSFLSCERVCQTSGADIDTNIGAGTLPQPSAYAAGAPPEEFKNANCFTPDECQAMSGSPGQFRAGLGCPSGEGKCVAPEPVIQLSTPIAGVSTVVGYAAYIAIVYRFLIAVSLIAAAIAFIYGGFQYIIGSAFTDIVQAKSIMLNAAIGLILTLSAVTILNTVNPATLNLHKIEIYMINTRQILDSRNCSSVKSSKPVKFGYAGRKPAVVAVKDASFTVDQKDTKCGRSYYASGYGNFQCIGQGCDDESSTCLSCAGTNLCAAGAVTGWTCVKASMAGIATYSSGHALKNIMLLAVCQNAIDTVKKSPSDIKAVTDAIVKVSVNDVSVGPEVVMGNEGSQAYHFTFSTDNIQSAKNDCGSKGGIAGYVLGVKYGDSAGGINLLGALQLGSKEGLASETSFIGSMSNVGPSLDDVVLLSKAGGDATGAESAGCTFTSYADGLPNADFRDYQRAAFCGMDPRTEGALSNPSNLWSETEIEAATINGGKTKGIKCSFTLDDNHAPNNPVSTNKKNGACSEGSNQALFGI